VTILKLGTISKFVPAGFLIYDLVLESRAFELCWSRSYRHIAKPVSSTRSQSRMELIAVIWYSAGWL